MIEKNSRKGRTDIYKLTLRSEWKEPENSEKLQGERENVKTSLQKLEKVAEDVANNTEDKEKIEL